MYHYITLIETTTCPSRTNDHCNMNGRCLLTPSLGGGGGGNHHANCSFNELLVSVMIYYTILFYTILFYFNFYVYLYLATVVMEYSVWNTTCSPHVGGTNRATYSL